MYIWNVIVEEKWNYHAIDDDGETDLEYYVVAAEDFNEAFNKVVKIALDNSRWWKDEHDEGNGKGFINKPISLELVSIERGDWLDG